MKKFQLNGTDSTIRRLYKKITELGLAALPDQDLNEYNMIVADMTSTYSTAKICLDETNVCPSSRLVSLDPSTLSGSRFCRKYVCDFSRVTLVLIFRHHPHSTRLTRPEGDAAHL